MFSATLCRLFCAAVLLAPAAAAAQQSPTVATTPLPAAQLPAAPAPRPLATIVRVDALPALLAIVSYGQLLTLRVGYEQQLAARTSGTVEALGMSYERTRIYGVQLQGRYYAVQRKSKQALCGLYLAPHVSVLHVREGNYYSEYFSSENKVGVGAQVGVQLPLGQRWRFDTSAGLTSYSSINGSTRSDVVGSGLAKLPFPELRASFGYAF